MANSSEATVVEQDLREIDTPKGALRYYDCGSDSSPVLLFLHGSGPGVTGWRNFRGILPTFAEHFRCLILEFPGFGVTDDFGGHPLQLVDAAPGKNHGGAQCRQLMGDTAARRVLDADRSSWRTPTFPRSAVRFPGRMPWPR